MLCDAQPGGTVTVYDFDTAEQLTIDNDDQIQTVVSILLH